MSASSYFLTYGFAVLLASGANAPAHGSPPAENAADLRERYPEIVGLENLVAKYRKASSILLEKAKDGATAAVELEFPDGSRETGVDTYFSSEPRKLREQRREYEAILIGNRGCVKRPNESWSCEEYEFDLSLRAIDPKAIFFAAEEAVACGSGSCTKITIHQATYLNFPKGATLTDDRNITVYNLGPDPENNRFEFELIVRPDGSPVSFTEKELTHGKMRSPKATFRFELDAEAEDFDLPEK